MVNKAKVKKSFNILIKVVIVLAAYGFLYYQLFHNEKLDSVLQAFRTVAGNRETWWVLAFVLLLMVANWSIEAVKWRFLMKKEESVGILKSLKAVFAGITVSIFTPNRMGEFLGRVFILKKTNPWRAIFITIIGSYSQLLVTLLVGYVSFVIFSLNYFTGMERVSDYFVYALIGATGIFLLMLTLLYLNVSFLDPLINRLINSRWKKIGQYFTVFSRFDSLTLLKVFGFSLLRYAVFTFQFVLLARTFGVPVGWLDGAMLVSLMFFVMSIIPTITLAELGIRGSVTISIFTIFLEAQGVFTPAMEFGVFSASSVLWLINLALPAIIGTFFVFQLRFFKKANGS
ncbi:MAG TPA: lysylphosphatidylglycerol synthase domain-containing protein [Bacteroidales bacterium]|nr:lysylphosphatidylglycerol synthase domain-containing protein [Bacteroidales bacterium]